MESKKINKLADFSQDTINEMDMSSVKGGRGINFSKCNESGCNVETGCACKVTEIDPLV